MTDGFNDCENVVCNFTEGIAPAPPQCSSEQNVTVLVLSFMKSVTCLLLSFTYMRSNLGNP